MTSKSHIAPVDAAEAAKTQAETSPAEDILALDEDWAESAWEDGEASRSERFGWIPPTLAVTTVLGWSGLFVVAHLSEMLAGASLARWTDWVTSWAVPVLLVATAWFLAMRNSRREAARFSDAGKALAEESTRLEKRLTTVNRELSLARDFIMSQGRDLESFGRVASERLSTHAEQLQALVRDNGLQVAAIATVSATALENMDRLRNNLPVVANSARDVANQIGSAGLTAQNQLDELVSGFHRLNEFGQASERQVQSLRAQVDAALAAFEAQTIHLEEIAITRFATLGERSETFRAELDGHEIEALASIRRRAASLTAEIGASRDVLNAQETESLDTLRVSLAALRDESGAITGTLQQAEATALVGWRAQLTQMEEGVVKAVTTLKQVDSQAMQAARGRLTALIDDTQRLDSDIAERHRHFADELEQRQLAVDAHNSEELAAIQQRLDGFDTEFAQRRDAQLVLAGGLSAQSEVLAARLETLQQQMERIVNQGEKVQSRLTVGLHELAGKLSASRNAIDGTDAVIVELTNASVRLLELIQASAQHSREHLPAAMEMAESRLTNFRKESEALSLLLTQAADKGQTLSDYVLAASRDGQAAMEGVDAFHARLSSNNHAHARTLTELRSQLAIIAEETKVSAHRAQEELGSAIASLRDATREAVESLESESAGAVTRIAAKLGEESASAIERALEERAGDAISRLEDAALLASDKSRDAAIHLRDQLAKVDDLARNLEARVSQARARAEEQIDNDFTRRVALITESLNSHAIDIAKAMSNEVTDTAWASYLRGDRGVFTRRAVKLLDNTEARAIAEIYGEDHDFREHVSRYVHDFESMLRTLLSTRDGHALSVTLLSSDMGKLYVALAQAIDRLRT